MVEAQDHLTRSARRKVRKGVVVSDKMDKTIVVKVVRIVRHPLVRKIMKRSKKYHAHDADNTCKTGDVVEIVECRPMSRTKTWRLLRAVSREG